MSRSKHTGSRARVIGVADYSSEVPQENAIRGVFQSLADGHALVTLNNARTGRLRPAETPNPSRFIFLPGFLIVPFVAPEDMNAMLKSSPFRNIEDEERIKRMLEVEAQVPENFKEGRTLQTGELRQFGRWIGLEVVYPEYADINDSVTSALTKTFSPKRPWLSVNPHVRIMHGELDRLTEETIARVVVPRQVTVDPLTFG